MRQRIKPQAKNETANPAKDLRVSMGLNPGGRKLSCAALSADGDQVPDPEKRSRQKHEKQASGDIGAQQQREMFFLLRQQGIRDFLLRVLS